MKSALEELVREFGKFSDRKICRAIHDIMTTVVAINSRQEKELMNLEERIRRLEDGK